jgi:ribonuclease BN (tRNA processing enzyme)
MTPDEQAGITRQASQGHLDPSAVGKMAARATVKTVVLSHLGRPAEFTLLAEEVKKHFSGQVLIAKDLMEF